jgi:transposase-like protein
MQFVPEQRRRFSPWFKAEAVQLVIETGKPVAEIAQGLGIHDGTLGNWVNAWRREPAGPEQPLSPVERARMGEMEAEIAHREAFATRAHARLAVADYIEVFYNRRRLHSSLGYRTPAEALTDHQTAAAVA